MKRARLTLLLVLALAPVLASCDSGTSSSGAASCSGSFEASVDQDTIVAGNLKIDVDQSGKLTGTLTPATGDALAVSGAVSGQAINIAISMGNDQYLFGSGTFTQPVSQCAGVAGGTFAVETIKGGSTAGRLPILAAPLQQPPSQLTIENKRIGIWGYAIGG